MFFFYDIGRDDFLHRKRCEIFYCADVRISHAKIIHMKDKELEELLTINDDLEKFTDEL